MIISILAGFWIIAAGPDSVALGIAVMLTGVFAFGIVSITAALKMTQLKNQEKEDRIKRLEEEVELLKSKIQ